MLQARLEVSDLEGFIIILGKKLSFKMRGTLEIGVFVAIANDLVLILRGKSLQAVINDNEVEMDETGLEAERKGNGESYFLRITKIIIMVATDEIIGNFY